MCVTICGRFRSDEGAVAGYGNRIRVKSPAKWGVQIAGMIFQTRSSTASKNILYHRCRNDSSVIHALRVMYNAKPQDLWIFRRHKTKKGEIYRLALLGKVWEVAVLPPTVHPSIRAFLPEPSDTTFSRIPLTVSDVFSEINPRFHRIFQLSSAGAI